jgi:pyruvate formate lyase activating enzyme
LQIWKAFIIKREKTASSKISFSVLRGIAERILSELGPQVPWHLSAYIPAYRFSSPPTPVRTLERAWSLAKEAGLEFVYLGNVLDHRFNHTYCPGCGTLLIHRLGFEVLKNAMRNGQCPTCGLSIAGVW